MSITLSSKVDLKKVEKFLEKDRDKKIKSILSSYGEKGVKLLSEATPKDTGETADSWSYTITSNKTGFSLAFRNSKTTPTGIPIVILLIYGHGTKNGGYVTGRDFINPIVAPLFNKMLDDIWKEVTST